jgi:hypothetical protein
VPRARESEGIGGEPACGRVLGLALRLLKIVKVCEGAPARSRAYISRAEPLE